MLKITEVLSALESLAPSGTAEDWDNVGLLVGDASWKTAGAVVCVDLTEEAIAKAVATRTKLIVNHHPCIFPKGKGLSRVTASGGSTTSSLVFEALRNGIAVAAYHTNFDQCAMEVIESVSKSLGVEPRGRLVEKPSGSLIKLSVFVPTTHLEKVREAICEAGAGHIGNYDFCTFTTEGEGSFRGGSDAKPFLGKPGVLEKAKEMRLETVLPRGLLKPVLRALMESHPYEEVAYDLYPVEQGPAPKGLIRGLGYGFWGEYKKRLSLAEVTEIVSRTFSVPRFWVAEPAGRKLKQIRRIGFVAGKGAAFIPAAQAVNCDVFVTGEVGYHSTLDGMRRGMAIMELGHRESERYYIKTMSSWLKRLGLKTFEIHTPTQAIWTGGK